MAIEYTVGIDLGGTNIVAGVVSHDYKAQQCQIVAKAECKTAIPRPEADVCDSMADVVKKAVRKAKLTLEDIAYIGIGVPGAVNPETGISAIGTKVSTGLVLDADRDIAIDFTEDIDWEDATPVTTQLATLAAAYVTKYTTDLTTITNSITLNFVQLSDLTERVDLCDTVHIYFEALGISASAKCIETTWDVLKERYISFRLKERIAKMINAVRY